MGVPNSLEKQRMETVTGFKQQNPTNDWVSQELYYVSFCAAGRWNKFGWAWCISATLSVRFWNSKTLRRGNTENLTNFIKSKFVKILKMLNMLRPHAKGRQCRKERFSMQTVELSRAQWFKEPTVGALLKHENVRLIDQYLLNSLLFLCGCFLRGIRRPHKYIKLKPTTVGDSWQDEYAVKSSFCATWVLWRSTEGLSVYWCC